MFMWLAGKKMPALVGGQAWPGSGSNATFIDAKYGLPVGLERWADEGVEVGWPEGINPTENVHWGKGGEAGRERAGESVLGEEARELREFAMRELVELRAEVAEVRQDLKALLRLNLALAAKL
jgi:hypothetical protein